MGWPAIMQRASHSQTWGVNAHRCGLGVFGVADLEIFLISKHHPGLSVVSSLQDSIGNLDLPGTPVPGYRLYRPFGTAVCSLRRAMRLREGEHVIALCLRL